MSDLRLSEKLPQLEKPMEPLVNANVRLLAAYHGTTDKNRIEGKIDFLRGNSMKITMLDDHLATISNAITTIVE